jgi:flagellar protein FlaG
MQIESYATPVPLTTVGTTTPDVKPRVNAPNVDLPSVSVQSSNSTEGSTTFPQKGTAELEKVTQQIQEAIQDTNISLNFSRDEESGAIVVKWVDQLSGEAIQQFPSEVALRLAAALGKLQGQFLNHKA